MERSYCNWIIAAPTSIKVYYAIDPWTTYEDYKNSRDKKAYGDLALDEQICKNTLYFYKHKTVYHKMHSDKAANNINDLSLDFVFLDGNHSYQYVVEDIKLWKDKLRKGGIISGHDIDNPNFPDVRAAVEYIFGDSWIKGDDYLWWKKIE